MSRFNPVAGDFQPQNRAQASTQPPHASGSAKVVNGNSKNLTVCSETQIDILCGALIDEFCSLRRDVDVLRRGGWKVQVGPFEKIKDIENGELEAIRERIAGRLSLNAMPPHLGLFIDGISERNGMKKNEEVLNEAVEGSVTNGSAAKVHVLPETRIANVPDAPTQLAVPAVLASSSVTTPWKPVFVQHLKPLDNLSKVPPPGAMKSFSRDFINLIFKGVEHSPGLWYIPMSVVNPLLPKRTFYLMDCTFDPYLPRSPGEHGAKLTAFFNNKPPEDESATAYLNVPLFISASKWAGNGANTLKANEYIYFGTYSQTRWSDKLDSDRVRDAVPHEVKQYWAARLADPARPAWITEALMKHFFAMPEYEGKLSKDFKPTDDLAADKKMEEDVKDYISELKSWKEYASAELATLTKEKLLEAFDMADADGTPGLRLWWEYLQCVNWDESFYNMLCKLQDNAKARR